MSLLSPAPQNEQANTGKAQSSQGKWLTKTLSSQPSPIFTPTGQSATGQSAEVLALENK